MTWHWSSHWEMILQLFCFLLFASGVSFGLGHVVGQRRGRLLALEECEWFLKCIRRSFSVVCVRGLIEGSMKRAKMNAVYQREHRKRMLAMGNEKVQ